MQDEAASHLQPLTHGIAGNNMRNNMRGGGIPVNIQSELMWIKQDANQVRNAVILLEQEKDSLRKAIRKLKLENTRMKQKMKHLQEIVTQLGGSSTEDGLHNGNAAPEAELDYDDINRDFFLVGGIHDPLSLRYEVTIRDSVGVEHKSAERFYWYKMAETFEDAEAMKKILQSPNVAAAEEAMKGIQNFDEAEWDKVKLAFWEQGQRLKFDQVRWISNLLVLTKTQYLAVASQDKFFGTGWRKNRQESNKPIFWDGLNEGGKVLMNIRHEMKQTHAWTGPQEEEETQKKFSENKRFVWRRVDPTKRLVMGSAGRGGMIGRGGGRGFYNNRPRGYGGGIPRAIATASTASTSSQS